MAANSYLKPVLVGLALLLNGAAIAAEPIRLTNDGKQKSDPIFIDGGKQLVYAVQQRFDQVVLMRMDLEKGTSEPLHGGASTSEFCATFANDTGTYAFLRNDGNLHVLLETRQPGGKSATHNPGGGFAAIRCISMAPDGSRVAFAFPEKGFEQQIFTLSIDGKQKTPITDGGGFDGYPAFSPDGRWLAFASTRNGNFDIHTMTADGRQIDRITEHDGLDTRPSWSPDGERLAFTSLRDGNYDIYVINRDGSNLQRITTHEERDDFCRWHPNGRQLVMVSERGGRQDLYLVDVEPAAAE